jgi:hypothetical protein
VWRREEAGSTWRFSSGEGASTGPFDSPQTTVEVENGQFLLLQTPRFTIPNFQTFSQTFFWTLPAAFVK